MRTGLIAIMALSLTAVAGEAAAARDDAAVARRNERVLHDFYPRDSIKRGEEGTVQFNFVVNDRGGIDTCRITSSSGYAALDQAACDLILAGSTAKPARDADGRRIPKEHAATLVWQLPASAQRPAVQPPFTTVPGDPGEDYACLRYLKTGSLLVDEKVCLSGDDWITQRNYARAETARLQTPNGPLSQSQ